ncbi:hypothetical protein PybrP1_008092 [[Pythium] brassicae (nom. inval.)]|nr:hypothetical protein PybrP1_008092 [[Pythium] brassicae (nom. inval.)]
MRATALLVLVAIAALLAGDVAAVDRHKFRTCSQTRFCREYRSAQPAQFDVAAAPHVSSDRVTFELQPRDAGAAAADTTRLRGVLSFVLGDNGAPAVRVHVTENFADPKDPRTRWENPEVLLPAALTGRAVKQVTVAESGLSAAALGNSAETDVALFAPAKAAADADDVVVALYLAPFAVDVFLNKHKVISMNGDKQFHYEIRRERQSAAAAAAATDATAAVDVHAGKTIVDYGEDGLAIYADGSVQQREADDATPAPSVASTLSGEGWEETFGGHTDKTKFGPSSVGMDITFHGGEGDAAQQRGLYGIPEHASDFLLKDTLAAADAASDSEREPGTTPTPTVLADPYRLYNLDVFEYELDETMALYGAIPLLVAPNAANTVGAFWHNPSETFVDIATDAATGAKTSHWMSESGVLDVFLLLGPSSAHFFAQYTQLTGRAPLPPLFAVAYHQCRWNYKNEADVARVDAGFDEHLIPYDVLWLDIEHTDKKKYFTWDAYAFPTPVAMQERVARTGRKMVTIVDPHIRAKSDDDPPYDVHAEAAALGLYIKDADGQRDFRGWCWPGDSSYVDFTSPAARLWWSGRFRYDKYVGSTAHLFTWNDMNEPSVFNGPEVSMPKSARNLEGVEHREWHNLYGTYMQRATMEGQLVRQLPAAPSQPEQVGATAAMARPFVLSRAFFAGSQRYGAIWTGDNTADWGHLKYATKMLLSMSVAGLSFVGADVGGFFGNPDTELLTRWYQAAAFQPFFRGHAHHDAKRREPWLFGEPHTSRLRAAVRTRYALLPYIYTLFRECATSGLPVMRPLWLHFAAEPRSFTEEDEFLLGHDLLVKPIVSAGVERTSVYLPGAGAVWYHVFDGYKRYAGGAEHADVPAPIDSTPVFQRGGSVIARKNRVRRSSALMRNDPYTLVVALDAALAATGRLYLDDEETHAAQLDGAFSEVAFTASRAGVSGTPVVHKFTSLAWVEKIEVFGFQSAASAPTRATVNGERAVEVQYDAARDCLVVRKPGVLVTDAWRVDFA